MIDHSKMVEQTKTLVANWETGRLTGNKNYSFRPRDFINVAYLYWMGVTANNPDLLSGNNTFILDQRADLEKILEQTRIDWKEVGFLTYSNSDLSEFVVKAANRKALSMDNDFTDIEEMVQDDANIYGSGYKKIWLDSKGIKKFAHVDPWDMIGDIKDFKGGDKGERITKSANEILNNTKYQKYNPEALTKLRNAVPKDDRDEKYVIYQTLVKVDGKEQLRVIDTKHELVFYVKDDFKDLNYIKRDRVKRRGFKDALGVGLIELIFNIIIQDKKGRERLDSVMAITSKLVFQKTVDGKKDKIAGRQIHKMKDGLVIAKKDGGDIEPVNLGGANQIVQLQNHINEMAEKASKVLGTPDVLQGDAKTLGANSSGVAIQSLAEYASSVHKDVKKRFARQIEAEYDLYFKAYILGVLDEGEDMTKYLTPTDISIVQRNIVNYYVFNARIDALGRGEDFTPEDAVAETEKAQRKVQESKQIPGALLERLRQDTAGIQIVISGEKASRQVRIEFFNEIKADYMVNPQVIADEAYQELIKAKAKAVNIDALIVEDFFRKLTNK